MIAEKMREGRKEVKVEICVVRGEVRKVIETVDD
jgi:hypothetical protein